MSVLFYFARNSFVRLASFTVGIAAAFLVTPHMLRSMGGSVYGVWSLISSLNAYFILLSFGLTQSVSNNVAQADVQNDPLKAQRIFAAGTLIGMVAGLLTVAISALLCLMADTLSQNIIRAGIFTSSLMVFAAAVGLQLLLRAAHGVLVGKMYWTRLAVIAMLRTLLNSALVLVFISETLSPEENLLRVSVITAISFVFESLIHLLLAVRNVPLRFNRASFSLTTIKELLHFGISILVLQIGELLRSRTQIYLVGLLLSVQQVTLFSVARQFINYMNDIILNAFGILNPYFSGLQAKGNTEECKTSLLVSLSLSYPVTSVVSLGLVFYGGFFLERWLGPEYVQIQTVLIPMALGSLFSIGDMPVSGYLIGVSKQAALAKLTVMEGLFNTLVCLPALLYMGLPGVGWMFFASAILFRVLILPMQTCAAAEIPPVIYYKNMIMAILPAIIVQYVYFKAIHAWLKPDYLILLAAGAGQFLAVSLVLFAMVVIRNRIFRPAQASGPELP